MFAPLVTYFKSPDVEAVFIVTVHSNYSIITVRMSSDDVSLRSNGSKPDCLCHSCCSLSIVSVVLSLKPVKPQRGLHSVCVCLCVYVCMF